MAVIFLNALLLGIEIDVSAKRGQADVPTWFGVVNATGPWKVLRGRFFLAKDFSIFSHFFSR